MAFEKRRGCGYRKVGGLYLVGGTGIWVLCDRLPILLDVCPACGGGIKPGLGFTWMSPKGLLEGDHIIERVHFEKEAYESRDTGEKGVALSEQCGEKDILCLNPPDRAGLMWVGSKFYTPSSFIKEAKEMGASKRINAIPKGFVVGETWVILAHRQAATKTFEDHEFFTKGGESRDKCIYCGKAKNGILGYNDPALQKCTRRMPGVFSAFKPERIEKLVDDDTPPDEIAALEKRGITVIKVPKGDKDHHGNVYEDLDEEKRQQREQRRMVKQEVLAQVKVSKKP
jgi:hypothetical protein